MLCDLVSILELLKVLDVVAVSISVSGFEDEELDSILLRMPTCGLTLDFSTIVLDSLFMFSSGGSVTDTVEEVITMVLTVAFLSVEITGSCKIVDILEICVLMILEELEDDVVLVVRSVSTFIDSVSKEVAAETIVSSVVALDFDPVSVLVVEETIVVVTSIVASGSS